MFSFIQLLMFGQISNVDQNALFVVEDNFVSLEVYDSFVSLLTVFIWILKVLLDLIGDYFSMIFVLLAEQVIWETTIDSLKEAQFDAVLTMSKQMFGQHTV